MPDNGITTPNHRQVPVPTRHASAPTQPQRDSKRGMRTCVILHQHSKGFRWHRAGILVENATLLTM